MCGMEIILLKKVNFCEEFMVGFLWWVGYVLNENVCGEVMDVEIDCLSVDCVFVYVKVIGGFQVVCEYELFWGGVKLFIVVFMIIILS